MTDKKPTDSEIKNALEYCKRPVGQHVCQNCPYVQSEGMCTTNLLNDTIDLITRLQAENNKYRRKVQNQRDEINRQKAKIEELTKTCEHQQNLNIDGSFEVKELKAENERLGKALKVQGERLKSERGQKYAQIDIITKLKEQLITAKSEAVKEFEERIKESASHGWNKSIDDIAKEMVGEGK